MMPYPLFPFTWPTKYQLPFWILVLLGLSLCTAGRVVNNDCYYDDYCDDYTTGDVLLGFGGLALVVDFVFFIVACVLVARCRNADSCATDVAIDLESMPVQTYEVSQVAVIATYVEEYPMIPQPDDAPPAYEMPAAGDEHTTVT